MRLCWSGSTGGAHAGVALHGIPEGHEQVCLQCAGKLSAHVKWNSYIRVVTPAIFFILQGEHIYTLEYTVYMVMHRSGEFIIN